MKKITLQQHLSIRLDAEINRVTAAVNINRLGGEENHVTATKSIRLDAEVNRVTAAVNINRLGGEENHVTETFKH